MGEPLRIALGVTGGIAAYKAPELVRRLRERGAEIRCVLTEAAGSFVSPLALEVVSGHRVYGEEYLEPTGTGLELHIELAEWADRLLVAPATANLLAQLSHGAAPGFLPTLALAFEGPVFVAPAMHPNMWGHPATRENVARLRARGVELIGPVEGPLASGEDGMGRMADPLEIVDRVLGLGSVPPPATLAGRRVLVSAGPTWEPIDPVRFLGNRSSGRMGYALAAAAADRGAEVDLVSGPVALAEPRGVRVHPVETAEEMRAVLLRLAPGADLVFMAAAVGDYRVAAVAPEKLKKSSGPPRLDLVENPDILREMTTLGDRGIVVGFAAETGDLTQLGPDKLRSKGCDLLVANDVSRGDIGFGARENEVVVFSPTREPVPLSRRPKREIAEALLDLAIDEEKRRG